MTGARVPENESERLAALRGYELLDTPPERAFDALTTVAAHLCDAPIALVSLIDSDRQWFKSRVGLPDCESTARDIAFCSYAILETGVFEVPDAALDARFARNPLVTAPPSIRFYAGAPLIDSQGMALGTICVLDRRPRELTPTQRAQLAGIAQAVVGIIMMRIRSSELLTYRASAGKDKSASRKMRTRRDELKQFTSSVELIDRLTARPAAPKRRRGATSEKAVTTSRDASSLRYFLDGEGSHVTPPGPDSGDSGRSDD